MSTTSNECEQHYRYANLASEKAEWSIARNYIEGFAKLAKVVDIGPLDEVIDLAWAKSEMRLSVIEAACRMVWE